MLLVRVLILVAYWALGLSCIQRSLTFLPAINLEPIPGPPIVVEHSGSIGWIITWTLLWALAGVLMILGPFIGRKVVLFKTKTPETDTQFRLDDLSFVLYAALMMTWGFSYYLQYFIELSQGIETYLYNSGAATLAPGIFVFAVWAISFTTRNSRGEIEY